jgi:hypothetical protein
MIKFHQLFRPLFSESSVHNNIFSKKKIIPPYHKSYSCQAIYGWIGRYRQIDAGFETHAIYIKKLHRTSKFSFGYYPVYICHSIRKPDSYTSHALAR